VELLIVIVVIGILAAIVIVAYSGVQARARDAGRQADIKNVQKLVELYYVENGSYPVTAANISVGAPGVVRTDANCTVGTKTADWVPGLGVTLPQSTPGRKISGTPGCYMYASDGQQYIISAWGAVETAPQSTTLYRRLGFRELGFITGQGFYLCNHVNIGGMASGSYVVTSDYYKYSYTVSNITTCNETPPAGA
jgi:type II secretory pathway pseudopilin PulG